MDHGDSSYFYFCQERKTIATSDETLAESIKLREEI